MNSITIENMSQFQFLTHSLHCQKLSGVIHYFQEHSIPEIKCENVLDTLMSTWEHSPLNSFFFPQNNVAKRLRGELHDSEGSFLIGACWLSISWLHLGWLAPDVLSFPSRGLPSGRQQKRAWGSLSLTTLHSWQRLALGLGLLGA